MNRKHFFASLVLGTGALWGQVGQPQFEVASVRPSGPTQPEGLTAGLHIDGQQIRISRFSFKDDLAMAYRVRAHQISGPDWIGTERFEIAATLPQIPGSADKIPEMLQALLAERFELKIHHEQKDFAVYAIQTAKSGFQLKPLPADAADEMRGPSVNVAGSGSAQGISISLGNGSFYTFANNKFEMKKVSMAAIARILERYLDRPVIDETGVAGNFDLMFDLTREDYTAMLVRAGMNSGVTLPPQALRALDYGSTASLEAAFEKVGLHLEAKKAPLDAIIVDSARKTPTEN